MRDIAIYGLIYLNLLAGLLWLNHKWATLNKDSGREPNGDLTASQTLDGLHNGRPWPFDSPADESSRPDTHDAS